MKPIALNGHTRALTSVKYNRQGDLLFSTAKDKVPCVWYSHNGERLGTFEGHTGTVWCCDVDFSSTYFVTGSADNTVRLWAVQTGECLGVINAPSPVRCVSFSVDGKSLVYVFDSVLGNACTIVVITVEDFLAHGVDGSGEVTPVVSVPLEITKRDSSKKVTRCIWGVDAMITGHANGDILRWTLEDLKAGKPSRVCTGEHKGTITDLQFSTDYLFFISACKDHSAKLIDADELKVLKTYVSKRPVNAASLSPTKRHVIIGGGQEASSVTTQGRSGKFDARLYHKLTEEEIGTIKGHFGPINTIAFLPDGTGYASGGEDGYIRLHTFDAVYHELGDEETPISSN